MTRLYAARVALPKSDAELDALLGRVPAWRREAALRLALPDDRARSLCAFLLARYAVKRETGEELEARPSPSGRPEAARPGVFFSLSHSGGAVACAVGDSPVGADVERIRPVRTEALARRFFAPEETRALLRLPPERRLAAFFELWTRKESYLKALGTGLARPLSSFCVLPAGADGALVRDSAAGAPPLRLHTFGLLPGYALSAACEGDVSAVLADEAAL